MTAEEICRRLLRQAMDDGFIAGGNPETFSSGDLVGMANLLCSLVLDLDVRELGDQEVRP